MSGFVDFKQIKSSVGIEQVVQMLDLRLNKQGHQLRGTCPIHHGSSDREFVVTPAKGLFYCFGPCGGGDLITLVAKVRGVSAKEAASLIARHFGVGADTGKGLRTVSRDGAHPAASGNSSPQPAPELREGPASARSLQPLTYLEAGHELVQALGVSPETAAAFGAGYAPKGIMRGRLAIPVRDPSGTLLAYCGRAFRQESPVLTFPSGFDPAGIVFNADRIHAGELYLVRDPLRVLTAFESGIDNVVALLTEAITARQLEMLAALMDDKHCESVELF